MLRRHFPPTLLTDLQASSQGALVELAQAFPYQPAAASLGLTRFTQVCASPGTEPSLLCRVPVFCQGRRSGFWTYGGFSTYIHACSTLPSFASVTRMVISHEPGFPAMSTQVISIVRSLHKCFTHLYCSPGCLGSVHSRLATLRNQGGGATDANP